MIWKEALEEELPIPCSPDSRRAGTASFMLLASSSGLVKAKRKKAAKRRENREQERAQNLEIADRKSRRLVRSRRHSQIDRAGAVKREGVGAWQRGEMAFQKKNKEKS